MVSQPDDADKGWNYVFQVLGTELFYTHSPIHPFQVKGILKDKVYSELFGHGKLSSKILSIKYNIVTVPEYYWFQKATSPSTVSINCHFKVWLDFFFV